MANLNISNQKKLRMKAIQELLRIKKKRAIPGDPKRKER